MPGAWSPTVPRQESPPLQHPGRRPVGILDHVRSSGEHSGGSKSVGKWGPSAPCSEEQEGAEAGPAQLGDPEQMNSRSPQRSRWASEQAAQATAPAGEEQVWVVGWLSRQTPPACGSHQPSLCAHEPTAHGMRLLPAAPSRQLFPIRCLYRHHPRAPPSEAPLGSWTPVHVCLVLLLSPLCENCSLCSWSSRHYSWHGVGALSGH